MRQKLVEITKDIKICHIDFTSYSPANTERSYSHMNQFHATGIFRYPLKTTKNLWFSVVFRGYRKMPVA